ncbi:hypothetical protein [Actinoallomurus sp. NPDC050550]|uniref:hypothetical protein n=1 Tax=Actinoallomurus sp. NPDC050550 TaxID=3154937 RepID=UPI0033C28EDA
MADTSLVVARLHGAFELLARVHLLVYGRTQALIGIGVLAALVVTLLIAIWRSSGRG